MRWCIYGAGGVGCVLAAHLHDSVPDLTLVARGAHLKNMQSLGLRVHLGKDTISFNPQAVDDDHLQGPYDIIILATKSHHLPGIAQKVGSVIHEGSAIVPVCNGVPWWFLRAFPAIEDPWIECLDPNKEIEQNIPLKQVVGGVVYMTAEQTAPGMVHNYHHSVIKVGEMNGFKSQRTQVLAYELENAGFEDPAAKDIRVAIWQKLCWNIVFNPLSVIKNKNSIEMFEDEDIKKRGESILDEMRSIAVALDMEVPIDTSRVWSVSESAGEHPPSMLQDFKAGKELEVDAILGAVMDIAKKTNVDIPHITESYEELTAMVKQAA